MSDKITLELFKVVKESIKNVEERVLKLEKIDDQCSYLRSQLKTFKCLYKDSYKSLSKLIDSVSENHKNKCLGHTNEEKFNKIFSEVEDIFENLPDPSDIL